MSINAIRLLGLEANKLKLVVRSHVVSQHAAPCF
jgi:hypothetical protein